MSTEELTAEERAATRDAARGLAHTDSEREAWIRFACAALSSIQLPNYLSDDDQQRRHARIANEACALADAMIDEMRAPRAALRSRQ